MKRRANPCGAISTPPDLWNVTWSKDQEARKRQLDHIVDSYGGRRKWMEGFRQWWDWDELADQMQQDTGADEIEIDTSFDFGRGVEATEY